MSIILKKDYFDKVLNKEYKPPFVPKLDSETDLKYFEQIDGGMEEEKKENEENKESEELLVKKEEGEKDDLHFEGFSYEQQDEQGLI